jgi:predicted DCC family thiol-disulfide oxidoreductase YuxK
MMNKIYIIYDSECGLCVQCRKWIEKQPAFLQITFLPRNSQEAATLITTVTDQKLGDELIVVSDEGGLYRGAHAWVMCLYALQNYRELGNKIATPMLLPWAKRICELVAQNRLNLSQLLGLKEHKEIKTLVEETI